VFLESLPEDVDPAGIEARYRDGVLRVSIPRRESALPKRIEVK
jgi:HSP20 family protein